MNIDPISGAFLSALALIFGFVFNLLATVTGAILGAAVELLKWVTSEGFISLSYTNAGLAPGAEHFNAFVHLGWTLTRDLTNIFFVLALVIIGLATALRIQDYQAKKALPVLIIIALLINFTPVILGLIVDASNIVMNFFIQKGFTGGNAFVNCSTSQWANMSSYVKDFWDPTEKIGLAAGSFFLIFFNLIAALIYFLFAFIFILRYIAIWTLVILSPFAFACYILPATKKVFSMWWQQFIQWSFIGAIAAFFLYLGDHIIRTMTEGALIAGSMDEVANAPGLSPIINNILPYFVALAFLFIGLFVSLTFAPKGADAVIKAGQRGINKTRAIYGKRSWAATKATGRATGRATTALPRSFAQGMKRGGGWKTRKGWTGGFKATGKTLTPPPPKQWMPLAKGYAKYRGIPAAKAAGRGLQKDLNEVWKTTIKPKKKRKLTEAEKAMGEVEEKA